MKRNIEPDYKFDMARFAEVLKAAIGDRSYSQFAKEAGISFGYTSKYVNMKHDVSPTVQTLKKIAAVSKGPSYKELLEAGGYDSAKYEDEDISAQIAMDSPDWSPMNALLPTFCRTNFKWQFVSSESGGPLTVKIEGAPFGMWYFIPVTKETVTREDISAVLGNDRAVGISQGEKVTFLTANEKVFNEIANMEFNLIFLRISVAYVEPQNIVVNEEKYVKTAVELTDIDREILLTNYSNKNIGPLSI